MPDERPLRWLKLDASPLQVTQPPRLHDLDQGLHWYKVACYSAKDRSETMEDGMRGRLKDGCLFPSVTCPLLLVVWRTLRYTQMRFDWLGRRNMQSADSCGDGVAFGLSTQG